MNKTQRLLTKSFIREASSLVTWENFMKAWLSSSSCSRVLANIPSRSRLSASRSSFPTCTATNEAAISSWLLFRLPFLSGTGHWQGAEVICLGQTVEAAKIGLNWITLPCSLFLQLPLYIQFVQFLWPQHPTARMVWSTGLKRGSPSSGQGTFSEVPLFHNSGIVQPHAECCKLT